MECVRGATPRSVSGSWVPAFAGKAVEYEQQALYFPTFPTTRSKLARTAFSVSRT